MARTIYQVDAHSIVEIADELKAKRLMLLERGAAEIQRRAIDVLSEISADLQTLKPKNYDEIAFIPLKVTVESWTVDKLNNLVDFESGRNYISNELCLHILSTNIPILAFSSVARALLVQSASIVRVPNNEAVIQWTMDFIERLDFYDSELSELVRIVNWESKDNETTAAALSCCDRTLIFGSDETINDVVSLSANPDSILTYGHRISFGLVLDNADVQSSAKGFAQDMTIFDQQGCLSPVIIFVVGDQDRLNSFAVELEKKLIDRELMPSRDSYTIAKIREAIELNKLRSNANYLIHGDFKSVIVINQTSTAKTFGIPGGVSLVPVESVDHALKLIQDAGLQFQLQGAGVAAGNHEDYDEVAELLSDFGVHYVCEPGEMQTPPFDWKEDGYDVLRSLI